MKRQKVNSKPLARNREIKWFWTLWSLSRHRQSDFSGSKRRFCWMSWTLSSSRTWSEWTKLKWFWSSLIMQPRERTINPMTTKVQFKANTKLGKWKMTHWRQRSHNTLRSIIVSSLWTRASSTTSIKREKMVFKRISPTKKHRRIGEILCRIDHLRSKKGLRNSTCSGVPSDFD